MKNILLAIILSMPLITSCEKDNIEPLAPDRCYIATEKLPMLLFYLEQGQNTHSDTTLYEQIIYIYDDKQRLVKRIMDRKFTTAFNPKASDWTTIRTLLDSIIYNKNGFPEENFNFTPKYMRHEKFEYNNALLVGVEYVIFRNSYNYNIDEIGNDNFVYNSNKKLIRSEHYSKNASMDVYDKTVQTYAYTNNNLQRIEYFKNEVDSVNKLGYTIYEQYDDMKNPYAALFFLKDNRIQSLSANNPMSKYTHIKTETSESFGRWKFTYPNYSPMGYPTEYPYGLSKLSIEYITQ